MNGLSDVKTSELFKMILLQEDTEKKCKKLTYHDHIHVQKQYTCLACRKYIQQSTFNYYID